MILGSDNRKRWSKWDVALAAAYQILESERCPQCGLPEYVCHSASNDIGFDIQETTCAAMRKKESAEEAAREKRSKRKDAKEPHGVTLTPVPFTYSGKDLTVHREAYYESLAERRRVKEEERAATRD